jgi:hypothetical protein
MSNSLAVAAVTTTLQSILLGLATLDPDLTDTTVTILPPDKARGTNTTNQLNLFLYQILPNAAWRNMNIPTKVMPGESGTPPLALNLYYLLTAFGRDDDATQAFGHELMGKAMSILYDNSILSSEEIQNATAALLPRSDLDRQVERVRITLQPLSVEEISKLWTGFATQYRLSVAYEVGVTLIQSGQPATAPLPVLTRGPSDSGIVAQSNLISPYPSINSLTPPNAQTAVRLGDVLNITGNHLDGTNLGVQFNHPLWTIPVEVPPNAGSTSTSISVTIPPQPAVWPAGFYTVLVLVQRPSETFRRSTNQLAVALAPSMSIVPQSAPAGNISYTVSASPEVWAAQDVSLLLGGQEIPADAHPTQTGSVTFQAAGVAAGSYFVRLRVDGVDSLLVNRAVKPPVFDASQQVTVT